jgi:hypothetical protein
MMGSFSKTKRSRGPWIPDCGVDIRAGESIHESVRCLQVRLLSFALGYSGGFVRNIERRVPALSIHESVLCLQVR